MKTPDSRGFSRRSFAVTIGDNVHLFNKRKAPPATADLDVLFGEAKPLCRHNGSRAIAMTAATLATFTTVIEEKKFYVPTGKFRTGKKTGKVTEEKIPMTLQTATVTITQGDRSFQFTATNRGTLVRDHRDGSRKPLSDVRAELVRLLGNEAAAADLAAVIAEYPPPKKKPAKQFSAPDPNDPRHAPRRLPGHGKPKEDYESVPADQFMAYLNSNLPADWESLPEIRPLPSRTH